MKITIKKVKNSFDYGLEVRITVTIRFWNDNTDEWWHLYKNYEENEKCPFSQNEDEFDTDTIGARGFWDDLTKDGYKVPEPDSYHRI